MNDDKEQIRKKIWEVFMSKFFITEVEVDFWISDPGKELSPDKGDNIFIGDLDRVELLQRLFSEARLKRNSEEELARRIPGEEAEDIIGDKLYVYELYGKKLCVQPSDDYCRSTLYNYYNGAGKMEAVVKSLKWSGGYTI